MAEYINKAELIKEVERKLKLTSATTTKVIDSLPTIDIVTCKECKWWKSYPYKSCEGGHGITDDDWFCADGERRTE